jgi:8-amino-7-oxononanoate synthase
MNIIEKIKLFFKTRVPEQYKMQKIFEFVGLLKSESLIPKFASINSAGTEPEAIINNKKCLIFCSNNYLGLSTHPNVIVGAQNALKIHGLGPGGSRFLCGNLDILEELDKKIADLIDAEDAITFPTGYMANTAIFKALMDPTIGKSLPYNKGSGVILSDEYNHGTIVDGCRLSYAKKIIFKHNDLDDLNKQISRLSKTTHKMIVTEGVFTLDGEITPLPEIVSIAKKHNAILMVDDAHGVGILGDMGGGTIQHFKLKGSVDIIMGSFDKALGGMGGFIGGNKKIIEYLRIVSRPYIFSSAISAVQAGGLIESINICKENPGLRKKLFDNANYLREKIKDLGFKTLGNETIPVIPLFIGDEVLAIKFSDKLFSEGIYVPSFRFPAVPKGTSRIRITPMASHNKNHLDLLLDVLEKTGKEFKLIP